MTPPPLTHILFDFFGTLVAYAADRLAERHDRSYQLLLAQGAALSYDDFLTAWAARFDQFERQSEASLIEFKMTDLCAAFLTAVLPAPPTSEQIAQFRDSYLAEWEGGVQIIPGVAAMTAALADRYALVLVSNTHHGPLVRRQLARAALSDHFTAVLLSDEFGWRKPSPAIFNHALQMSGGRPETALFVGDSYTADYLGARGAGLTCLLIDPGRRYPIPDACRLDDILETPAALRRLSPGGTG